MSKRSHPTAAPTAAQMIEPLEPRVLMSYTRFAVIGDSSEQSVPAGTSQPLADVAKLIKSWNPSFIATVGDNNYGSTSGYETNVGKYFHDYIKPYTGAYGAGSPTGNRFWPTLGNHDYLNGAHPYLAYFTLPGNERYYTMTQGNVELFVVNSNYQEPDGTASNSVQAKWLKAELAKSNARWKIVLEHHSPYTSSAGHGSQPFMQWPFAQWGATAVITGHDHLYERVMTNGIPYFVDGLGGRSIYGFSSKTVAGSAVRYNADYGAMRIDAYDDRITFQFITRAGHVADTYTINAPATVTQTLIPQGDTWKYLDNGSNQGTAWRATNFTDTSWKSGAAQLGYGDGDESTVVSYGSNASSKRITTYFRKSFSVTNPADFTALNLQLLRDDGAAVYLNGTEIFRSNLPAGATYTTVATTAIEAPDENTFQIISISPARLVKGKNVMAVEVHQNAKNSDDLSFDLLLRATRAAATTKPATPSTLRATAASPWRINLTWTDTSNNETGFLVERSTNGSIWAQIASVPAGAMGYADSGLLTNKKYWYRVRAYNAAGKSSYSSSASAMTPKVTATTA